MVIGVYANNQEVIIHDPWTGPFKVRKFPEFRSKLGSLVYLFRVGAKKMDDPSTPWMS